MWKDCRIWTYDAWARKLPKKAAAGEVCRFKHPFLKDLFDTVMETCGYKPRGRGQWADVDFATAQAGFQVIKFLFGGRAPPSREHMGIRTTVSKIQKIGFHQTSRQVRIWALVSPERVV